MRALRDFIDGVVRRSTSVLRHSLHQEKPIYMVVSMNWPNAPITPHLCYILKSCAVASRLLETRRNYDNRQRSRSHLTGNSSRILLDSINS